MLGKVGRQVQVLAVLAEEDVLGPILVDVLEGHGAVLCRVDQLPARQAEPRLHPLTWVQHIIRMRFVGTLHYII